MKDPLIEELHKIRREYAASLGNDLEAIASDIRKQEKKAKERGAKFVSFAPKPAKPRRAKASGQ